MELRHLRYFLAVGEALSFTKAAARLRVAQPALSRQVKDLEDEIGADLVVRGPRGLTLTAEGRLFLEETRRILTHAAESVEKVRALSRGHESELHVGYASALTVELLPPALAAFEKAFPRIHVVLHDVSRRELIAGLESGAFPFGVIPVAMPIEGVEVEVLRTYPYCVALPRGHHLARRRSVALKTLAGENLIGLRRDDFPGLREAVDRLFTAIGEKRRSVVECDTTSSLITAVEAGRGVALTIPPFRHIAGTRLVFRPLTPATEEYAIGIARTKRGSRPPIGEEFCKILRRIATSTGTGRRVGRAAR